MPRIDRPPPGIPAVLDIEASGFGTGSYPIEVGVVMPDASLHCFLVRPEAEWTHWDSVSESVHGISRDMLLKHGKAVEVVADGLNSLLKGMTVYSDAWGFDQTWLSLLFHHAHTRRRFQIEPIWGLLGEDELRKWDRNKRQVIEELGLTRHRASADALILQLAYRRTANTSLL